MEFRLQPGFATAISKTRLKPELHAAYRMKGNNQYSRTAEGVALFRTLEQLQPADSRILNDPYAAAFLQHPRLRLIARSRLLSRAMQYFLHRWSPGSQEMLTIRARLVDDLAIEMAATGLEQIVMLGAGFDASLASL